MLSSEPHPGTLKGDRGSVSSGDVSASPDVRLRPLQVTWEITRPNGSKRERASSAKSARHDPQQFSTAEAFHLIEEVAAMRVPLLALVGGDPFARPDLFPVIEFASKRSVRTSLTLHPTPALLPHIAPELKASGVMRVVFWLYGSTSSLNDSQLETPGSYRRTLDIVAACHEAQLPVQVNTMLTRRNIHDLDAMIALLTHLDVALWNVFFYVPNNRDDGSQLLSAQEHEDIFARLYAASENVHFQIKTTEGQHYQRYLLQQRIRESRGRITEADALAYVPNGVNDGRASVFINYRGDAYPSRFLPMSAGDVTRQTLSEVYCDSPLFVSFRDSSRLKGKCGRCPARNLCGGSRARAYALTGDLFAPDPCCAFEP